MDKNQITAISLIVVIVVGWMVFFRPDPIVEEQTTKTEKQESATIEKEPAAEGSSEATAENGDSPSVKDSTKKAHAVTNEKSFEEQLSVIENSLVKITLSNAGGQIQSVQLKTYDRFDKKPLLLLDKNSSHIKLTAGKSELSNSTIEFTGVKKGNRKITYTGQVDGQTVTQTYSLSKDGFTVDYDLSVGSDASSLDIVWEDKMIPLEEEQSYSRQKSTINYFTVEDDFDDFDGGSDEVETETLESAIKWISMKQRFFNAGIITKQQFNDVKVSGISSTKYLKIFKSEFNVALKDGKTSWQFYFGPNDYDICEEVAPGYENNVYLGWFLFRPINRFIVLPIFDFLESFIGNYGIIILILVFIVKLLLFPIAYRSYLGMAKMKELKPEIDILKEKHEGDQQGLQMAQMQLYKQVGVNPLSGCIPMLLQMPVLLALFNFFPNAIHLRGESFLWAHDLSTYDDLINFGTSVPLIGDHISIFTLMMTLSTLAYTYYNNQINTTAQGPMKNIGYIMPVVFFFALNNFSAGLTWYYFVSNLITISQQLLATRFIDKEKIRLQLEANKNSDKPKNQSKFQARIQEAMKAQEEERKKKGKK